MTNNDVFKTTVEDDLKKIARAKLDILILQRQNETLCKDNDKQIKELTEEIESRELSLENNLQKSGERKIDTSAGWCAYRAMPDKWEYDTDKLIFWATYDEDRKERYIKIVHEFRKAQLKKDYAEGIIVHDDVCDEGLTITPQDPKFSYKLNGGL